MSLSSYYPKSSRQGQEYGKERGQEIKKVSFFTAIAVARASKATLTA